MKNLLKNLGILVVVIGVLLLIIPAFLNTTSNTTLGVAAILMVVGLIGHIMLNKYITE
jgi:nicotinamide riboside transporter PnuC